MDEDKFKYKLMYCLRKKCPICGRPFVYFCLRCVFVLRVVPHGQKPFHRNVYYSKKLLRRYAILNVYLQRAFRLLLWLYLYYKFYKILYFLAPYCDMQKDKYLTYRRRVDINYNKSLTTLRERKQALLLKIWEKDTHKKNSNEIQEIKRKSVTSIQSGHPNVATSVVSSSSIKSKKSSNLLSAFVRRAKRRKNKTSEIMLKSVSVSTQKLNLAASNSSLGIHTEEEIELSNENCDEKLEHSNEKYTKLKDAEEIVKAIDSSHSIISTGRLTGQFFRKFMKRQPHVENERKKSDHSLGIQTGKPNDLESKMSPKDCPSEYSLDITNNDKLLLKSVSCVPTSFINFRKSALNVTLSNGLQSVQELASRFRESEEHLIQMLCRYVKDPSFQKELLDTLSQHSKLQWEAERRTSALANDMWMHQIEIGRTQERTLQETLNSLVKQNRQLQTDNEIIFRKHEKLVRKLRSFPEMSFKYKCVDCETQMDHIIKHNEKLQCKLDANVQQLENLEHELHGLKKKNDSLEDQLRNCTGQIHSLKATVHRSKIDYEMEIATVNCRLQNKEDIIKEGMEAGAVLLEDLDLIKRQCTNLPFTINWSKFKSRGSNLADLIHISRSCINEFSKELISLQNQLSLKEKDVEALQETNTKLQEYLKKSTTELDKLSKKIDESTSAGADRIISEQKYKMLETNLKCTQEQLQKLSMKHDQERSSLLDTIANYENLNQEVSEKNKMIDQTKIFISNITSENLALRKQVEGLNRILAESGAGDVAKELATCQEQIAYFQTQYYELLNERQHYVEEMDALKMEKGAILESQEESYRHLQEQVDNLDKINKENTVLRQQLESEHQTVLSLQNERMKYLEEKNMLKTIFHHMKAEITRVQKLEGAVADISKEASKLAMVAEYNKQVGEKLKSEVLEKDQTIFQLRTSVEKLNDIQVQNTKEKLSLCYELSEVCQMKDKLSSILSLEVKKNMALDDSKRELIESASTQLKKYEEMQKNGRSALKDVLQDYKFVITQRDALLKDKEKMQQEITELRMFYNDELRKSDILTNEKHEKDKKISELTTKQDESKNLVGALKEKVNEEVSKYDANVKQLEKLIRQLRKEKIDLEDSVKYLQNNIQKLYNDLNESRKGEKETKDMLNKCLMEKEALEKDRQHWEKSYSSISNDKERLLKEINYLNSLCEKVLVDFEASIKSSNEKEEMFKKEIVESKSMLLNNSKEIDQLNVVIQFKQQEIDKISEEYNKLKKHEKSLNEQIKSFEKQTMEIKDRQNLEDCLSKTQMEYESSQLQIETLRKEVDLLQKQLNVVLEQREEDYSFYKKHMDEMLKKNEDLQVKSRKELGELKINLNDVLQKLNNERAAYATLSEIHKDVSAKYLKSIKDAVDEKNIRQEVEAKLKDGIDSIESLQSEKADLQQQINILLDGLNEEKNRINTLIQEKDSVHKASDDLQRKYNDVLAKCLTLENQLRGMEFNMTESSEEINLKFQEQVDRFKNECQENHELILALKENIGILQQQITGLEFQKSEVTLRLHETQRKFETEQGLCEQLKNTHKLILAAILKMKDDGKVDPSDIQHLLHMSQNADSDPIDNNLEC